MESLQEVINTLSIFWSPPYFYFRFRLCGHRDGPVHPSNRYQMVQIDFLAANHVCIFRLCDHAHRAVIFAIVQLSCSYQVSILSVRAFCFGRRVCRLPSVCCLSVCPASDLRNYARYKRNLPPLYRKSGSPSKNMTSDFAPELAKQPKGSPKPKIVQNSVRAYCLALLSDAACFDQRRPKYRLIVTPCTVADNATILPVEMSSTIHDFCSPFRPSSCRRIGSKYQRSPTWLIGQILVYMHCDPHYCLHKNRGVATTVLGENKKST